MRRALVLAGALAALAGCSTYTEPLYYRDGAPILRNGDSGEHMHITRCCTFLGMKTAGPVPGRRSRSGAGFWAGHGLAAPSR